MNCLLVEDNLDFAYTLTHVLELEGFAVTHASNGVEGLKAMAQTWDLILTDMHMPELGGHAMIVAELDRGVLRGAPIVFMSADKYELDKVRHCSHTLFKPFEIDALKAMLDVIFGRGRRSTQ